MAKTATAPAPAAAAEGDAAAPAKKKGKLPLIIGLVVLLLAAGGGGAWWFLGRAKPAHDEHKEAAAAPPQFHQLEPFTVNLAEENGDHYLQVVVVYQVEDSKVVDQFKTYLPVLRNRIIMLLSAKKPSDLAAPEGKQALVNELVAAARESLPGRTPERGVLGAFLGAFVVQ